MRNLLTGTVIVGGLALATWGVYQFSHRLGIIAAGLALIGLAVSERTP